MIKFYCTKKILILFVVSILVYFPLAILAQNTFISFGSDWNYYDLGKQPGVKNGYNWYENEYDDQDWSLGGAQLGYGDGDENTVIGDTVLTAYFRHLFTVNSPASFSSLSINTLYDDGFVLYLNGTEVGRINMPEGIITYNTFALQSHGDNAMILIALDNILLAGDNVLAVEVHQRSVGSSDISFDCKLIANPPGVANIIRGPYLQRLSDKIVTVQWRTSAPVATKLSYGVSIYNLNHTFLDTITRIDHQVNIDGLEANQSYFYQIESDSAILSAAHTEQYFKTASPPGSRMPIRAWILGDCGTKNANARNVRNAYYDYVQNDHTDLILFLGDNAYSDGTDEEYQFALFENMYEDKLKNSSSWSCLGNHDGHSAHSATQSGPYYDIFTFPTQGECGGSPSGTEAYYSFDYGNVHFISLDSYDSDKTVEGAMYDWCESDLQNTTADWIVAFWHHPPYSKGSHDSDTESALIKMRENFLPLLESYGVDLVLNGHSHSYERSYYINGHYGLSDSFNPTLHTVGLSGYGDGRVDGTGGYSRPENSTMGAVYITAGSSGKTSAGDLDHEAMYFSVSALGSCVLEVDAGELTLKFLRESGVIDDYFTIVKDLGCTIGSSCDDLNICTINDTINELCQCKGTPVNNSAELVITENEAPIFQTYKSSGFLSTLGNVFTLPGSQTILIAPEVQLNPHFTVSENSTLEIMQDGCAF